jgi:hypothetical protein
MNTTAKSYMASIWQIVKVKTNKQKYKQLVKVNNFKRNKKSKLKKKPNKEDPIIVEEYFWECAT